MSQERGASFNSEIFNTNLPDDQASPEDRPGGETPKEDLRSVASLSKNDNPFIAEQLAQMGIPYPSTPEEWDRAGEEVDRKTAELLKKIQLAEEQHDRDRAPIREQQREKLQKLQEELDQLRGNNK